jgi:hypothetical protein
MAYSIACSVSLCGVCVYGVFLPGGRVLTSAALSPPTVKAEWCMTLPLMWLMYMYFYVCYVCYVWCVYYV